MTALAMGRNWRKATPEQQKQLDRRVPHAAGAHLLRRADQYRDQTIDYKPLRDEAGRHRRHRAHRGRAARARRRCRSTTAWTKTADGWKVYDVIVGGVSAWSPTTATSSTTQIKSGGVDGLIKTLADKNKGAPAK